MERKKLDRNRQGSNGRHNAPLKEPQNDAKASCHCHCPQNPPPKLELKTMPCGHKMGGRNLIVCIDGTANQFGKKNTNVIEIYNLILKETGDNQRTWYNSGIGTYARPHWKSLHYWKQVVDHKVDLAIAWHFEKTVLEAYQWLSDNYEDGDCIFLFGFSRGAFQVRALSGMIYKVGLIHKGNQAQIPFAFELYADPKSGDQETTQVGSTHEQVSMAQRFKEAFSRKDVRVHFVGVWDTVSSIGIARKKRVLPHTTDGMTHVCYFRQALALDERRVKFLPEYAWGGATLPPPGKEPNIQGGTRRHNDRLHPHTLEVWFPGTHSDIGGGNATNDNMDRSRPPMRWMALQAAELGLRIGIFKRELLSSEQIEFQESLDWLWKPFEILPFQRLTFSRTPERNNKTTYKPHLGSGRKIHRGQKIHCSFILGERKPGYTPKARPHYDAQQDDQSFWSSLRANGLQEHSKLLELDAFCRAAVAMKKLLAGANVDDLLRRIAADRTGPQVWYDEVIETLRTWDEKEPRPDLSVKCRLLQTTIDVFQGNSSELKLAVWNQIPNPLTDLLRSDSTDHRKVAQDFQRRFTMGVANCLLELRGHAHGVRAVAISPDGKHVVSGSYDETIRIWNAESGEQVGEPLRGYKRGPWSVAISPDGKHVVSGACDNTIRIWDAEAISV